MGATVSSSKGGEVWAEWRRRVVGALKFVRRSFGEVEDGTSCPCLRELVEPHSASRPRRVAGHHSVHGTADREDGEQDELAGTEVDSSFMR